MTTVEDHVRNIINAVEPWELRDFGPDRHLSAGEVVAGANYLNEHFIQKIHDLEKENKKLEAEGWFEDVWRLSRQVSKLLRFVKEFTEYANHSTGECSKEYPNPDDCNLCWARQLIEEIEEPED